MRCSECRIADQKEKEKREKKKIPTTQSSYPIFCPLQPFGKEYTLQINQVERKKDQKAIFAYPQQLFQNPLPPSPISPHTHLSFFRRTSPQAHTDAIRPNTPKTVAKMPSYSRKPAQHSPPTSLIAPATTPLVPPIPLHTHLRDTLPADFGSKVLVLIIRRTCNWLFPSIYRNIPGIIFTWWDER